MVRSVAVYTYLDSTVNSLPRLWVIRLPKKDEADMDWWSSGRGIAEQAMRTWTQMWADKPAGIYRSRVSPKITKEPDWRGLTSAKVFEIAVKTALHLHARSSGGAEVADRCLTVWEEFYPAGVWACDTEFTALPGERQLPICVVARDLNSGRTIRQVEGEFCAAAPFPTGADALFVAFVASAECGTFRALGWEMPDAS